MPEIQYPKNPNSDTAFVVQEDGTKNRALMTAPQDTSSLELPTNSNSCKGYVTVDGKKQRVILTADIGSGGGGGSVDYAKTVQRAETMPTADSSNAGQQFLYSGESDATYTHGYIYECVTDDNTTWYWKQLDVQPSAKVNTTATLAVADWSSNTQTVVVNGVMADSVVFVSPAPSSASDYASAGILCTAQAADSLSFTCTTTPSNAITVNVVCM